MRAHHANCRSRGSSQLTTPMSLLRSVQLARLCTHHTKTAMVRLLAWTIAQVRSRILLARHRGSSAGQYSALTGFVEVGESLEDAVRREVAEETGVQVGDASYVASQAWPFPSGLMIGFRATATAGDDVEPGAWGRTAGPPCRAQAGV
jgi:NADH pyrophosphatase NudC (nudix superfamily)